MIRRAILIKAIGESGSGEEQVFFLRTEQPLLPETLQASALQLVISRICKPFSPRALAFASASLLEEDEDDECGWDILDLVLR